MRVKAAGNTSDSQKKGSILAHSLPSISPFLPFPNIAPPGIVLGSG